jgi:hypothetical protein
MGDEIHTAYRIFGGNLKEGNHLGDISVFRRIILNTVFKNMVSLSGKR